MHKILVIEDEYLVRENILERLDAEGFDTISAENGVNGLKLAREQRPDLIICDVMMPELDGYGVLSALRQEPSMAAVPFIFLTAKADKLYQRQGMELGADDYLTKPFTKNELLGAIAARLEKRAIVTQQAEKKLQALRQSITEALPQQLLNPLSEIFGYSQMLVDHYDSIKPHGILETGQNIHNSAERLNRLIENFLMYAQIELLATNPDEVKALSNCQTLNANDVIAQIASQKAKQKYREADLSLHVVNASLKIAKPDLKKVVEELIDNAFKFSQPGTPIEVKGSTERNIFSLSISNYGQTMTPQQIANVGGYMQFNRQHYQEQGLGLGLIISKRIIELHGGQLSIQCEANVKTTVCMTLRCGGEAPSRLRVF